MYSWGTGDGGRGDWGKRQECDERTGTGKRRQAHSVSSASIARDTSTPAVRACAAVVSEVAALVGTEGASGAGGAGGASGAGGAEGAEGTWGTSGTGGTSTAADTDGAPVVVVFVELVAFVAFVASMLSFQTSELALKPILTPPPETKMELLKVTGEMPCILRHRERNT